MDKYPEMSPSASNIQDMSSWYNYFGDNKKVCREILFCTVALLLHSHRNQRTETLVCLSVAYSFYVHEMILEYPLNEYMIIKYDTQ